MAGMKEIKNRINSVTDTQKITNAMYMIASTKMRKAKQDLDATRPYFDSLAKEIKHIFATENDIESRFFYSQKESEKECEGENVGYLVITADKGLAGAYNHNIIKQTVELMKQSSNNRLFVVGNVGRRFFEMHGYEIEKSFLYTAQKPSLRRADEIGKQLCDSFKRGELSRVVIVYTNMKNSIAQEVCYEQLLPLPRESFDGDEIIGEKHFEYIPGPVQVLESIAFEYLTGYIYSALVDSFCCEQNARMMAMDSANSNAEQIRTELLQEYNHLRQNAITQEITEVAAGAKAKRKKMEREKLKRKKESAV